MKDVVIAGYARSPFHLANKGALIKVRPDDMAGQVVRGLIERTGVNPEDIEDLILGCAFPEGEQGFNMARLVAFLADLPLSVAGATVNRFCGSSMQSIHIAAGAIQMNAGDAFICAGVESMTRTPMGGYNPLPNPDLVKNMPEAYVSMGVTAENLAQKHRITRDDQQRFAIESQQKAAAARTAGRLADEIVPIKANGHMVEQDGCIRPETTMEGLSDLKPAFDANGTVTAGASSPLTDGAAATLVTSAEYAEKNNLPVLAKVKSIAVGGCRPELMGIGPVTATEKALDRADLDVGAIDIVELNEAFASQAMACIEELGLREETINLDGGAIALGHPLGATGARIAGKAASLLKREGKKYALATQCIGGGQGIATILEAV